MKNTTVRQLAQKLIILCDDFKARRITDKDFRDKLSSLASIYGAQLYSFEGLSSTIETVIGKKRAWIIVHFLNNSSIASPASEDVEEDEYEIDNIIKYIISNNGLSYKRSQDHLYMDIAIKHLMSWNEITGLYKGKKLEVYKLLVNRVIYMSSMSQEKEYKGYKVSSRIFINKLNEYILFPACVFDDIIVGEMVETLEIALNNYSVSDVFKYTESFIWDYLVTCRLKLEMQF